MKPAVSSSVDLKEVESVAVKEEVDSFEEMQEASSDAVLREPVPAGEWIQGEGE